MNTFLLCALLLATIPASHCFSAPGTGQCPGVECCSTVSRGVSSQCITYGCDASCDCTSSIALGAECDSDSPCVGNARCNNLGECIGENLCDPNQCCLGDQCVPRPDGVEDCSTVQCNSTGDCPSGCGLTCVNNECRDSQGQLSNCTAATSTTELPENTASVTTSSSSSESSTTFTLITTDSATSSPEGTGSIDSSTISEPLPSTSTEVGIPNSTGGINTGVTVTVESSDLASGNNSNSATIAIVSAVSGVVLVLGVCAAIFFLVMRRKKREEEEAPKPVVALTLRSQVNSIKDIKLGEKIGDGNFGEVYRGKWGQTDVALKKFKNDASLNEFDQELATLRDLRHPHCVQFLGVFVDEEGSEYIVMEYMSRGSLLGLLRSGANQWNMTDLISVCYQTALGMQYLEEVRVIHRDLSARNLLVSGSDGQLVVKVSDFGMSKQNTEYYKDNIEKPLPVRWCAPEVLEKRSYSTKSDVFSFGVVMWEVLEYGKLPYGHSNNAEVYKFVLDGSRLERPLKCNDSLWELMNQCWQVDPASRPTFHDIAATLRMQISESSTPSKVQESHGAIYANRPSQYETVA